MDALIEAVRANLNWVTPTMIVLGTIVGIVIGALPGLSATMGMALFSPLTFYMSPIAGIPFLLGLYKGGTYGGSVSAILIGTPGTAANAATVLDGYPMRQKGQGGKALRMAIYASTIGDFFSDVVLVSVAVPLAMVAVRVGQADLCALILFSLTMVCYVSGSSLLKGLVAALLGLFFTMIGLDAVGGSPRLTFGVFELTRGISIIPMVVGIFALSEVMVQIERPVPPGRPTVTDVDLGDSRVTWPELRRCLRTILRSSIIGSVIGALPGIGAETSSWLAYGMAKRASKTPERFGKGELEGVAAPEAGNNAVCGATLIPMLTFGIPGDIVVAVMMGAFMAQGLRPGPLLLQEQPQVIYALFVAIFLASLAMFLIANYTLGLWVRVLRVHPYVLYPIVVVLCVAGSYAINTSVFDLGLMVFFGVLGYLMRKLGFPIAPFVLAFVLGPMFETTLRQSLQQSQGDATIFVTRPISAVILLLTVLVLVQVIRHQLREGAAARAEGP